MKPASLLACRASDCAAESSKGLLTLSRSTAAPLWSALLPASLPDSRVDSLVDSLVESLRAAVGLELTLWNLP